jgi:hypothetical protein
MHFISCYVLKYISLQRVCYRVWVTPMGRKTRAGMGMGMGKNLNPHAGMSFLAGRVRVSGCGYGMALPNRFLPVAISSHALGGQPSPCAAR